MSSSLFVPASWGFLAPEAHPDRNGHDLLIAPEVETTRLLLACPDRPGLIATVSGFLAEAGLNIVDVDQHSTAAGRFFMRMVFDSPRAGEREALQERFDREVATPYEMEHSFSESTDASGSR